MIYKKILLILLILFLSVLHWKPDNECGCGSGLTMPFALMGGILGCKGADTSGSADNTENDTAGKAVKSSQKNIVTFVELGSVNCIPCRMMKQVMDKVEEKYGGQVKIIFYDVWTPEGRPYAMQYGIRSIPTQVFLDKNGKEYSRHSGFFPFEDLEKVLKKGGVE